MLANSRCHGAVQTCMCGASQVRGLLDKEEVLWAKTRGLLRGAHLLVATPSALAEAMAPPDAAADALRHARLLVVDEVDACFQVGKLPPRPYLPRLPLQAARLGISQNRIRPDSERRTGETESSGGCLCK